MAEENSGQDDGKKKSGGMVMTIAGAAALALISGAAAFALAPAGGGSEKTDHGEDAGKDHGKDAGKDAGKGHGKDAGKDHGGGSGHGEKADKKHKKDKKGHGKKAVSGEIVYVPMEPLIVSLGPDARADRLKITLVIEGRSEYEPELQDLMPKFRDVLNTYLRAAETSDFESPAAMARVRAHIARRLKIVAPEDSVVGVLITEFILD